ncbi:sigma-70 family RNA polymerase sigma factor [Actinokineospora alba]|uniref:sigma-70 family RNA polymerase sigma factor n=1 Tax=Actinokineospora alba TaxID=504798 RepID=UPI000B8823C2|nr:sigma-70 family RNA polymerase sigma factor [Actinokineospora alba]
MREALRSEADEFGKIFREGGDMQSGEPSDATLVLDARAGDDDAFTQLHDRYRAPVTRFVTRTVGDPHLAEDLVQEAFVSALRNLDGLREPARFRPWLFSIAHRGALDHVRKDGPLLLAELPELADSGETPHEAAAAREAAGLVWDAAASLEPRQLAILELTVRDEVSNTELAQALDVRPAHAAVLAHRARTALGHAVRLLLLVRNPRRCGRLAELVPEQPRTLSAAQRVRVDRHIRRCGECRDLAGRVTAPVAIIAVLLAAADREPVAVDNAAWSLVDPSPHLLRKSAVTLALTFALTVGWWFIPGVEDDPIVSEPTVTPSAPISFAPVAAVPTTTVPPPPAPAPTTAPPRSEADRLIVALNNRRIAEGCGPLHAAPRLMTAARAHSEDMMRGEYIGMTGPDGTTLQDRVADTGYRGMRGGYVAAYSEKASEVVKSLASGDAVGLSCEVDAIGVGRTEGGPCGYYWAVIFGRDGR